MALIERGFMLTGLEAGCVRCHKPLNKGFDPEKPRQLCGRCRAKRRAENLRQWEADKARRAAEDRATGGPSDGSASC